MKKYHGSRGKTSWIDAFIFCKLTVCAGFLLRSVALVELEWHMGLRRLFHRWIGFLNSFLTRLAGKIQSNSPSKGGAHLPCFLPAAGWSWRAPPLWVPSASVTSSLRGHVGLQENRTARPSVGYLWTDDTLVDCGLFYLPAAAVVATEAQHLGAEKTLFDSRVSVNPRLVQKLMFFGERFWCSREVVSIIQKYQAEASFLDNINILKSQNSD